MTPNATILLVDDSPRIRPLVRAILCDLDCQILDAATAEEALELAAGQRIDLLLTDVMLPGLSGFDLADRLRRRYPAVQVLFMSGYSMPTPADPGMHFIEKPFRPDALLGKVRGILRLP